LPPETAALTHPFPEPPGEGRAVEVAPGILWMRLPLPMALDHVNIYALADGDGWTVVDTGVDSRRTRALWQSLLAGPLAGRPVARVLVTHHHPDHIGLAGWFLAQGAALITTRTAWLYARMLVLDVQERPSAESAAFWRAAGMPADLLAQRLDERPFNFADCVAPLPAGFTRIGEGSRLRLAGRDWTVRVGHGHAPEQATLWSDDGLVLSGDQVLPKITPNIGVYPTEPDADPLAEWIDSCRALLAHAQDSHLVLPGHRLPFRGLPQRLHDLIAGHHAALDRLRAHLAVTPATACALFPLLYGRPIGSAEFGLALVEAVAHLNHLRARGEIGFTLRDDGARLWRGCGTGARDSAA
jgi:glyoxylase-like metal-dependent hydrolase (beta-lactamase superfamily II)